MYDKVLWARFRYVLPQVMGLMAKAEQKKEQAARGQGVVKAQSWPEDNDD
jgi:hypothetical protein